jgi:hypothetical protein
MNLFFLHENPVVAATLYCDQHLGKIRLEAAQMLSTAYHLSPHVTVEEKDGLCYVQKYFIYKKAFVNHPTCVWVRTAKGNFDWCLEHLKALQAIWENRGNNGAMTGLVITSFNKTHSLLRSPVGMTDVPLAMYDAIKQKYKPKEPLPVAVQAYRDYMCAKQFKNDKRPTWTINKQPEWYHVS